MRDFLDGILNFIDCESLTDLEFAGIDLALPLYDQATYEALANVLKNREVVSTAQDRLIAYFKAKGFEADAISTAQSNILVGMVLE